MNPTTIADRAMSLQRMELARRHGLEDVAMQSILTGESENKFRTRLLSALAVRNLGGSFSFKRMVEGLAIGKLNGLEAECLQETARISGKAFDPQRVTIPWAAFTRDLTAASAGTAGYLVATEVGEALDVLRPWSVTARAGVSFIERLQGNMVLPRTNAKATGYWLPSEGSGATASTPQLGSIAFSPKTGGGFIQYSRQLNLQANIESYIRRELLRTIGTLLDGAVINGSGASGQPLGLLNTANIGTTSGTALAYSGVVAMKSTCATANAPDDAIVFIGTPGVRQTLETRERATGSGFVWDQDQVASRPAHVTTDMPSATLVCGAWSDIVVGLWGVGFELEINPFDPAGFKTGLIQSRLLVSADVGVAHPTAFVVAIGVN